MPLLTRDAILAAEDLPSERVEVPEWGGEVLVRGLTGSERDAFLQSTTKMIGEKTTVNLIDMHARLVSLTLVDEQGKRLFTDADLHVLGQKSGIALERVFAVAQRLSGLTKDEVTTLTKNL